MSRNRTVCFRGSNLERIDKKAKEKGIKANELINIAVEEYLNKQNDELRRKS